MSLHVKAIARALYADVPGLAALRFGFKELADEFSSKPEYFGTMLLKIGEGLIVDVGAHRGHSIAAFRRLALHSEVVAFEPSPDADRLRIRFLPDRNVTVKQCALGSRNGTIRLFVPTYGRWNCDGMAATSYAEAVDWMQDGTRLAWFDPKKVRVEEILVDCRTLDSFELEPKLIKLHAQRAEHDILLGSEQTIRSHQPAIMCAFPQENVVDLLAGWGYQPYVYRNRAFAPGIERDGTFTWFLHE